MAIQFSAFIAMVLLLGVLLPAALSTVAEAPAGHYFSLPELSAQKSGERPYPQGSIGKWPGGHKAPSFIVTVVVVLMLAAAMAVFVIHGIRHNKAELEAARKMRKRRIEQNRDE